MADATSPELPSLRVLRRLWSKLAAVYGTRWTSAYGLTPERLLGDRPTGELTEAGAMWQQGLAGLGPRDLSQGMSAAVLSADPWPPTLPAFRALALGVPTLAQVQLALVRREPGAPPLTAFCRLVWRFLDGYQLARADAAGAQRLVRDAYELAREYRMALGELPPEPVAAVGHEPPPRPTAASAATAAAHMARIAATLGVAWGDAGDEA